MRFALWLLGAMLLAASGAMAEGPGAPIHIAPIAGAVRPFNESFARYVAQEAQALGLDASTDQDSAPSLELIGTASAVSTKEGAVLVVRWALIDHTGAEIVAFTIQGTAPYRAQNPWEAIDGGTLRWLAAATARELEYALQFALPPTPEPRVARAAVPARTEAAASEPTASMPARVNLAGVKGAPGDGNEALARALAQYLGRQSIVLVPKKEEGAYVIEGRVTLSPASAAEDTVSILWLLADFRGRELARIEQANAVPKGSLLAHWGQTAVYAAEGAADGFLAAIAEIGPRPPGG